MPAHAHNANVDATSGEMSTRLLFRDQHQPSARALDLDGPLSRVLAVDGVDISLLGQRGLLACIAMDVFPEG